ncbi:hypothetical protein ANTQUA_LOCUS10028, partial [Anthophora quadrimaculata]
MKTVAILLCTLYLASYAVVRGDDDILPACLQKMDLGVGEWKIHKRTTNKFTFFALCKWKSINRLSAKIAIALISCLLLLQADEMNIVLLGDIPKLMNDNSDEGLRKRGCIEACFLQNNGLMNENIIDMQKINEQIDKVMKQSDNKEIVRKAIEECVAAAANDDECLVASSFVQCNVEHLKRAIKQIIRSA